MPALVIVESPAKAKTIEKFLGTEYQVIATYGHIRDLPSKDGSVDPEQGFRMNYEVAKQSSKHVTNLTNAAKQAEMLLLATDPDREGEAISWHVLEVLRQKKELSNLPAKRVVFHEITKRAIQEAIHHAREIDMDMVNAQQARRALDYLVGFNLSPLLWKKVRPGLSAGRVQSVALRLVCERDAEIAAFQSQEYWSILVDVEKIAAKGAPPARPFRSRLVVAEGHKLGKFDIPNAQQAQAWCAALQDQPLFLTQLEKKQTQRHPSPPFITSTLQQEASRKLGFSAKKTMMVAQRLYEGVELPASNGGGGEVEGLISYMRTDSVNLAEEALVALQQMIQQRYGPAYLPEKARTYKSSAKNAQEAHEAIRPTNPARTPESLKSVLPRDLFVLYELIWKRTMACQMASARIDQVTATLAVGSANRQAPFQLRANGSSIAFAGFLDVYSEGLDDVSLQDRDEDAAETMLPPLQEGEQLRPRRIDPQQHFTEPPPRFTEATLVKALESYGIGRPSTYAPIMSTLQDRGYVRLEQKKFFPEDVGLVVNRFLVEHFQTYVDYHFTAHLEDDLDAVSRGEQRWIPLLEHFWQPFQQQVSEKEKSTRRSDVTSEATDELCPECQQPLLNKLGRFGRFLACSNYPECRYTRNLKKEGEEETPRPEPVTTDQTCEKCGQPMLLKEGRYGKFLACSGYPQCRNNQPLEKPKSTGITCPACGKGSFLEKKSRFGKIFYSCSGYPKCKNALWNEPVAQPCPQCAMPFVTRKVGKRIGTQLICVREGCTYQEKVEEATP
ncbi:type I DNA topoisomerase [Candidatus Magnetaquicoccus inordinatus]|uniref:type I DNA topoisomerase n=1 Tax=Candidatus Magnetaquicoccus inordinatus TaxID=2496818 RepID=UPI00102ADE55|nr:type I DNA topoisomerase [Candidatus Magnetaquicoccus inordinatus]